ncbi:MAG: hypothetical protein PHT07_24880, partial [Paludibacter sp.]|nr:hypothetical protein [Paludibacter sp.]
ALAHEWFHAFDSYLGIKDRKGYEPNEDGVITAIKDESIYNSQNSNSKLRDELRKAWRNTWDTMRYKSEQSTYDKSKAEKRRNYAVESLMNGLNSAFSSAKQDRTYGLRKKAATPEQIGRWDALIERVKNFDFGEITEKKTKKRYSFESQYDVQKQLNDLYKEITGREMSTYNMSYNNFKGIELYNEEIKRAEEGQTYQSKVPTTFYRDSVEMDKVRASSYWSTNYEMSARAFESFMDDQIKATGFHNDYLVHSVNNGIYQMLYDCKPYPEGEERNKINEQFKNLFNTIETKEENGNIGMFKIDPNNFYSPTEKALGLIQQNKGTVEQFKAMLLKNGAKQAEMDWMGWDDQFPDIKKMVTKSEIQEWIDQNKIEVKEVVKGEMKPRATADNITKVVFSQDGNGSYLVHYKIGEDEGLVEIGTFEADNETEAKEQALERINNSFNDFVKQDTKFSQYTEPGGENYKELLLTMPNKPIIAPVSKEDAYYNLMSGFDVFNEKGDKVSQYSLTQDVDNTQKFFSTVNKADFKSSHYDEPNILAHIRFNERTGENGERILFVEEFQSDWAQKGKKEGFDRKFSNDELLVYAERNGLEVKINGENMTITNPKHGGQLFFGNKEKGFATLRDKMRLPKSVPNMPFSKTDQWVNLAFRRMILYATENGFDRIAWTNGEMQAARYDLSKQVKSVNAENTKNSNKSYQWDLTVTDNNGNPHIYKIANDNELADTVGKDLAEKIIADNPNKWDSKQYSDLDLKVGGSGMKAFYDSIIPSAANKLGKPFGAKVEETEINSGKTKNRIKDFDSLPEALAFEKKLKDEGYKKVTLGMNMDDGSHHVSWIESASSTVQSLPVTNKMIESVKGGVPLFKQGETSGTEIIKPLIEELENDSPRNADVRFLTPSETADLFVGKMDEEEVAVIRKGNWVGFNKNGIIVINPKVKSRIQAVQTWVHEKSHIQIRSEFTSYNAKVRHFTEMYNRIAPEELERVLGSDYNDRDDFVQAEEYYAYLAEEYALTGEIKGDVQPEIKNHIFDIVNAFTTTKKIEDVLFKPTTGNDRSGEAVENDNAGRKGITEEGNLGREETKSGNENTVRQGNSGSVTVSTLATPDLSKRHNASNAITKIS